MAKIGIRKIENLQPTTKNNLLIWLALIASTITTSTIGVLALSGVGIAIMYVYNQYGITLWSILTTVFPWL